MMLMFIRFKRPEADRPRMQFASLGGEARSAEYAYMCGGGVKFRVKNHARVGNVLEIRVKAIVRKNGVIVSSFLAECYDKGKGEWKKVKGRHEVNIASLRYPPKKGKGLTLVCPLGIGGIVCLHDPQPTWEEDEDND